MRRSSKIVPHFHCERAKQKPDFERESDPAMLSDRKTPTDKGFSGRGTFSTFEEDFHLVSVQWAVFSTTHDEFEAFCLPPRLLIRDDAGHIEEFHPEGDIVILRIDIDKPVFSECFC